MAKPTKRIPTNETEPLTPEESPEAQQTRLKAAVDAVQAALTTNRAILVVNNLKIIEGKLFPEIQIQILK